MKSKRPDTLLITEDYWANSQLSVVRHYGRTTFNGFLYIIVDKRGKDVWECTHEANLLGRSMAIPEGEPCDLIWDKLQPAYRTLGRDRILQLLKENKTFDEIKAEAAEARKERVKKFDEKQTKIMFQY